jgi:hypothetical protein
MSYSSVEISERSLLLQFVVVLAHVQARESFKTCRQLSAFNVLIAASLDFARRPMEAAYNANGLKPGVKKTCKMHSIRVIDGV